MHWNIIWGQAICPLSFSFTKHQKCTIRFSVASPLSGDKVRLRFSNISGKRPYIIGECTVKAGGVRSQVTKDGKKQLIIPRGGTTTSDEVELKVISGEKVEISIYYVNKPVEGNAIEENAYLVKRMNLTQSDAYPPLKSNLFQRQHHLTSIPLIDAIEVYSKNDPAIIVAFGDSITQRSQWTKPLETRLFDLYQENVVLINKGISGNRILYPGKGRFKIFGDAAKDRLERDVLNIRGVKAVIFELGANDIGLAKKTSKEYVTTDQLVRAMQEIVEKLKARDIRVTGTTLLPAMGAGRHERYHEVTRNEINEWILSYDGFDYVVDFDKATRAENNPGRLKEAYDCGDHVHPSKEGGKAMAESIDVRKLIAFEGNLRQIPPGENVQ
jgi:lysophospholipase L1-like esterase